MAAGEQRCAMPPATLLIVCVLLSQTPEVDVSKPFRAKPSDTRKADPLLGYDFVDKNLPKREIPLRKQGSCSAGISTSAMQQHPVEAQYPSSKSNDGTGSLSNDYQDVRCTVNCMDLFDEDKTNLGGCMTLKSPSHYVHPEWNYAFKKRVTLDRVFVKFGRWNSPKDLTVNARASLTSRPKRCKYARLAMKGLHEYDCGHQKSGVISIIMNDYGILEVCDLYISGVKFDRRRCSQRPVYEVPSAHPCEQTFASRLCSRTDRSNPAFMIYSFNEQRIIQIIGVRYEGGLDARTRSVEVSLLNEHERHAACKLLNEPPARFAYYECPKIFSFGFGIFSRVQPRLSLCQVKAYHP